MEHFPSTVEDLQTKKRLLLQISDYRDLSSIPESQNIMAPKNKTGGDKKGKGKAEKAGGAGEEKSGGKVKPTQQINVRHILVSHWLNTKRKI